MPTYSPALRQRFSGLLSRMQVTRSGAVTVAVNRIYRSKARYQAVAEALGSGIPWYFIAAFHYRESTNNFAGVLHNGDEIIGTGRLTYRIPKGRGPFETWEESAMDALWLKGLHEWTDWSMEAMCYLGTNFNGWGYEGRHPSPYLWAGTNLYTRGKFIRDKVYDASHVDTQLGIMPIIVEIRRREQVLLVETNSRKVGVLRSVMGGVQSLFVTIGSIFTMDNLGLFTGWLAPLNGILTPANLAILVVGGAGVLVLGKWLIAMTHEDHAEGRYDPRPPQVDGLPPDLVGELPKESPDAPAPV